MDINQSTFFSYMLSIEGDSGKKNTFFTKFSGIDFGIEPEENVLGGESTYKFRLPSLIKHNLVLENGMAPVDSELVKWINHTVEAGLEQTVTTKNIEVSLLSITGETHILWTIFDAWPIKWQLDPFNDWDKKCTIISLEFVYNKLTQHKMA